ncbi:MAG: TerB family tellurite resistance protein [Bacteroidales bacterium]|nr:TerB family tellurite resistance protein [Bacteroidales bacterium]
MAGFGKWIGGGLGWAFLGPLGGLLGFAIGSMFDKGVQAIPQQAGQTQHGDLVASLLVLTAAMMKADGKVLRSELNYVKNFLVQQFGEEAAKSHLQTLKVLLDQNIPVAEVAQQISRYMDYSTRLQLMHYLWGIAAADNDIDPNEIRLMDEISYHMGINQADFNSIKAMFIENTESAYQILEIDRTATNEEVKKAYREMAIKYHPDKVSHLGDDVKKSAEEKIKKVNEAYEKIKKERGIK